MQPAAALAEDRLLRPEQAAWYLNVTTRLGVRRPAAHRAEATLSPVQINAEASVARLQRTGLIDAPQAAAVDRQIAAGSTDPNDLVASGVVDEAQMQTIGSAVDAAKAAG